MVNTQTSETEKGQKIFCFGAFDFRRSVRFGSAGTRRTRGRWWSGGSASESGSGFRFHRRGDAAQERRLTLTLGELALGSNSGTEKSIICVTLFCICKFQSHNVWNAYDFSNVQTKQEDFSSIVSVKKHVWNLPPFEQMFFKTILSLSRSLDRQYTYLRRHDWCQNNTNTAGTARSLDV